MAQARHVVFTLDNRGSGAAQRAFTDSSGRLGGIEVRDQLAGARWLQGTAGIDPKRIGCSGGATAGT